MIGISVKYDHQASTFSSSAAPFFPFGCFCCFPPLVASAASTFLGAKVETQMNCFECGSTLLKDPFWMSCLRRTLAIDPPTLNFSMIEATVMAFPCLGISATILSYPALSRKTALLTFSLTFPLVHFLTPFFF